MFRPKVFLALPEYGFVSGDSREAAYARADTDQLYEVHTFRYPGSLLAHVFNHTWCSMVNSQQGPYDYFAMLHADVVPGSNWLATLINRMDYGGSGRYDLMHALVAIKDDTACYSTCMSHSSIDRLWEIRRKVTIHEGQKVLPETFGTRELLDLWGTDGFDPPHDDLCMAPNTGCMVISLRSKEWRNFPGFTVLDRLVVVDADGKATAVREGEERPEGTLFPLVVPEDWGLGAWCHRRRLKVGATRAVETWHGGTFWFTSTAVRGPEQDARFMAVLGEGKRIR